YSRAARVFFAMDAAMGRDRMDALLRSLAERYGYLRLSTEAFLREARDAGAPAEVPSWLAEPRDPRPEDRPRGVRFFLLGPPPARSDFAIGLLPLFGGRSRDDLVAGVRIAGNTRFRIGGPYSAFLSLPAFHVEADLLRHLDGGQAEVILIARQALGRQS